MEAQFIKATAGMQAFKFGTSSLVKVECYHMDGGVKLQVVSGHNGKCLGQSFMMSTEEWNDRPHYPYDDMVEAHWALRQCKWIPSVTR